MTMWRKTKIYLPLVWLICFSTAAGELTLTSTPNNIKIGLTKTLGLDCSYKPDPNSPINGLVALFVSRALNETDGSLKYEDIASINAYVQNVSVFTNENVLAYGEMSKNGVSHIHINWTNPTAQQSGLYRCEAHGVDAVGHNIVLSNSTHVTTAEPDHDELLDRLKEMDGKLVSMEQKLLELYSKLNEAQNTPAPSLDINSTHCTPAPCCVQTNLTELCPSRDSSDQTRYYPYNLTYSGHGYHILRSSLWGVNDAVELCHRAGSYLVEIANQAEYQAVTQFLNSQSKVAAVAMAGRYSHGHWSCQTSGTRVGYFHWKNGEPIFPSLTDCIMLTKSSSWMMEAVFCSEVDREIYALCESN